MRVHDPLRLLVIGVVVLSAMTMTSADARAQWAPLNGGGFVNLSGLVNGRVIVSGNGGMLNIGGYAPRGGTLTMNFSPITPLINNFNALVLMTNGGKSLTLQSNSRPIAGTGASTLQASIAGATTGTVNALAPTTTSGSGTTTGNAAMLVINGLNSTGTSTATNGGTLTINGSIGGGQTQLAGTSALTTGGVITYSAANAILPLSTMSGGTLLIGGQAGSGQLQLTGSSLLATGGTVTLSGSNTTASLTTVSGGTLTLVGGQLSNGAIPIGNTGQLLLTGGSVSTTVSLNTSLTTSIIGNGGAIALGSQQLANPNLIISGPSLILGKDGQAANQLNVAGGTTMTVSAGNSYSGTVQADGKYVVNGTLDGNAIIDSGGKLGGSGVVLGDVSGSGIVAPGNSPGVLDADQVNPTTGIDFLFEFTAANTAPDYLNRTAAINDVLHLTNPRTPFLSALTNDNSVTVDFQVAALHDGDFFRGGFFTDLESVDFYNDGTISNAMFNYLLNGSALDMSKWQIDVSTVARPNTDFGPSFGGVVNGRETLFHITAIPEPGSFVLVGAAAAGWYARRRRAAARA